jgi:hypothetical protein
LLKAEFGGGPCKSALLKLGLEFRPQRFFFGCGLLKLLKGALLFAENAFCLVAQGQVEDSQKACEQQEGYLAHQCFAREDFSAEHFPQKAADLVVGSARLAAFFFLPLLDPEFFGGTQAVGIR